MCVCVWNELISSAVAWFFLSSPQTLTSTFILALPHALFLSGFLPPHISLSLSLLPFPSVFSSLMVVVTRAQECSHAPQLWVVENRYPLSTTFQTEMYSSVIDSTPFQATTRTNKRLSLSLFLRLWVALRGGCEAGNGHLLQISRPSYDLRMYFRGWEVRDVFSFVKKKKENSARAF